MSFDCQFKIKEGFCRRINRECAPGERGCILHGRFSFPLKEDEEKEGKRDKSDREDES